MLARCFRSPFWGKISGWVLAGDMSEAEEQVEIANALETAKRMRANASVKENLSPDRAPTVDLAESRWLRFVL